MKYKFTDEHRKNLSEARKGIEPSNKLPREKRNCETCFIEFESKITSKQRFCGRSCATKKQMKNPENHPNWRGDDVGYTGVHLWLTKKYGKPKKCEMCGIESITAKDGRNKIQWANLTGKYRRSRADWMPMCVSCHHKYDNQIEKLKKWRQQWLEEEVDNALQQ